VIFVRALSGFDDYLHRLTKMSAPTSADACLSIVHSLMCHRKVHLFNLAFICNGILDVTLCY